MAGENEKTGPSALDVGKNLSESLKNSARAQGDLNKELNTTISLLEKTIKLRDDSIAKVKALNQSQINTKAIEKEIEINKRKQVVSANKVKDLEADMNKKQKKGVDDYLAKIQKRAEIEAKIRRAIATGDTSKLASLNRQLGTSERQLLKFEESLSLQQRELAGAKQARDIASETVGLIEAELEAEKKIASALGVSGTLMGAFAKKLGVGKEVYAAMVEKARQLNEEGDKSFVKLKTLGAGVGAGMKSIWAVLTDPFVVIGGLYKAFSALVELALSVQDRTVKFGRALGLSYENATKVRIEFAKIAMQSGNVLINTEKLMQSQEELTSILGTNNILAGQILTTNIQLKELAGLEADTRAEIAKTSLITGKSSADITKSVLAQVVGLEKATGISFNYQKILKEASTLGGYLGLSFAKYPAQLTKSLTTVKAMGLELKQLDSMASSFLDFESSISKEFEAQLLTGRNINLSKARELFLNNDLAGAAQEITSQVGSAGDFLKLNRIQAESLASAFGMSRDQMAEMLKQQQLLAKIGASQTDNAQKQYELGIKRFGSQKALAAAVGEEAYQSMLNASAQEKLTGFMDKIKQSIADFVANSPLIPLVEKAINWLSSPQNIQRVVGYIQSAFALIFDIVGKTAGVVMKLGNFFGAGISEDLINTAFSGGDAIRSVDLAGSVPSVGANRARAEARSMAPAYNNSMAAGNQRVRGGDTFVSVNVDPITGNKVVKTLSNAPGPKTDYSPISNPD